MRQPSNVRCYLPKHEVVELLTVIEQIPAVKQKIADDYNATDDFARSIDEAYRVIRERMANGGPGWNPK